MMIDDDGIVVLVAIFLILLCDVWAKMERKGNKNFKIYFLKGCFVAFKVFYIFCTNAMCIMFVNVDKNCATFSYCCKIYLDGFNKHHFNSKCQLLYKKNCDRPIKKIFFTSRFI